MTIRLRGTGRAFTDRVKGLWGDAVNEVFPRTWMPAPRETTGTAGTLRLAPAPAAMANAGAMNLTASHLIPLWPRTRTACPRVSIRIARVRQPARPTRLAAWEDEGGATALLK